MGIKAGSGKGGIDRGGGKDDGAGGGSFSGKGNKPRRKIPFAPPPPKEPYQPIPDSPFPENKGFKLGQYRVVEERDNYVICRGFDPNAKDPFAEITPSAYRTIKVAKPPILQRSAWDGQTVTIGGVSYTYTYTDTGVRTAQWTNSSGTQQQEERIDTPYLVDDLITAVEIRKNAGPVEGMEVTDEDGTRLRWLDLNVSGRHWHADSVRYAKLTADLAAATSFLTTPSTAAAVIMEEDGTGGLTTSSLTIVVTNRWVDLSLTSGKYLVVQRIGTEWVIVASECP